MYMTQANEANAEIRELNNQVYMARYIKNYLTNENNKHQLLPANSSIENASLATQLNEYNTKLLERNSLVSHSSVGKSLVGEMDKLLEDMRECFNHLHRQPDGSPACTNQKSGGHWRAGYPHRLHLNPKQSKYLLKWNASKAVKESLYLYLLQKREENELSQAFTAYNTRIITSLVELMIPTAPHKEKHSFGGFCFGAAHFPWSSSSFVRT